jgi:hypothetical protein
MSGWRRWPAELVAEAEQQRTETGAEKVRLLGETR